MSEMLMKSTTKTLAALLAVSLAGCSLMPDYERPAAPVAQDWPGLKRADAVSPPQRKASDVSWQAFFPDPRLQALIGAALEHNRDMKIAVARIDEARAQWGVARADRFPSLNAGVSRNAVRTPPELSSTGRKLTTQRYDAGLSMAAFEVDFWGRVGSLSTAAQANYLATEEAQRAFRLSLIADVANAYLTALELAERVELSRATLKTREETRAMVAKRREVGLAGDLDYLQADGAYQAVRSDLASLERQWAAADNFLTQIVGQLPATLPEGKMLADQGIVADLAAGIPSEVLLSRPDVRAAEQKLIAANANIGAARAAFLPKLLLTAFLGSASKSLAGLFDAGSGAWSFQPSLSMPLFDMGRTAANTDIAEARKVIAVAEYEKAIQTAFREVADQLTARDKLAEQLAAQTESANNQAQRLKLADARYQAGISSYLEVLDAQRDSFSARQNELATRRAYFAAAASLYKALGGGAE